MSEELFRRVVIVVASVAGQVKDKSRWWRQVRSRIAYFVCSGNECQAPSEFVFLDCWDLPQAMM